jgi:hypothetical protein
LGRHLAGALSGFDTTRRLCELHNLSTRRSALIVVRRLRGLRNNLSGHCYGALNTLRVVRRLCRLRDNPARCCDRMVNAFNIDCP